MAHYYKPAGAGGGAPTNAEYLLVSNNGSLSQDRRFVAGSGLAAVDGGANGDYTLSLDINGLAAQGETMAAADTFALYDATGAINKKVTFAALEGDLDLGNLSGVITLTTQVTGTLPVGNGGTGVVDPTDHALVVGSGAAAMTALAVGTTGQLLVGATGADPAWATNIDLPGTLDVTGETALDAGLTVANPINQGTQLIAAGGGAADLTLGGGATAGITISASNASNIHFGDAADTDVGRITYDHTTDLLILATDGLPALSLDSDQHGVFEERLGVGGVTPTAQLHVDQSSATGAIPVLLLDQADISEEMIEFTSAPIAIGNAIEGVGAKSLSTTHFIKCTITGVGVRYLQLGTIA